MILHFPNPDTLRLALTAGAVPPSVSTRAARAHFAVDGGVWVEPTVKIPGPALAQLARLGVTFHKTRQPFEHPVFCWPQLLPLQRTRLDETPRDRTAVLFDLPEKALPEVVAEILRLGNDRQGYCHLTTDGQARVLLRVLEPPYYALLRALDRDGPNAPRAYVEHAARVWIEVGWTHPLAEHIRPPAGKLLFMRPARDWELLPEARFHDIYDVLEFVLPDQPVTWKSTELLGRFQVPLRLTRAGTTEQPELWVLHEQGREQVDELVRNADNALLARLAFVVAMQGDARTVVVRVRPSRQSPPVLVFQGVAYRSYLRLPNLFVPCDRRLHPPLRRDAIHRLLASDPARVTWLDPRPDGGFVPQSVPDDAFRPLQQWVDYVLDQDHEALAAWLDACRFDFERFVCREDNATAPPSMSGAEGAEPTTPPQSERSAKKKTDKDRKTSTAPQPAPGALPRMTSSELEQQLRATERRFLELDGGPDAPARQALWPELARLHAALGHGPDATICWTNALWTNRHRAEWYGYWLRSAQPEMRAATPNADDLDRLLANRHPAAAGARALCAYLAWATQTRRETPSLVSRLGEIAQFLEKEEVGLPVRAAWLGWLAMAQLSGGDVLALARARDRLLERLYQHGLRSDVDLPGFLRFAAGAGDRFGMIRDYLLKLRGIVGQWIESDPLGAGQTRAYTDLLFAFGLACLRENTASQQLLLEAIDALGERDEVHKWLLEAYEFRITQALEGKPPLGQLSDALLERLEKMDDMIRTLTREQPDLASLYRLQRYKIDRLREHSRILEPQERIDPYRHWRGRHDDALDRELAHLPDINDRAELARRLMALLTREQQKKREHSQTRILVAALGLAPRLGDAFAREMLERVPQVLSSLESAVEQALLLEKALFLAAHFDQAAHVQSLVARFHELLETGSADELAAALDTLLGEVFRGLRKLGMRDEIGRLLERMANLVLRGRSLTAARGNRSDSDWARQLRVLLHVAAGWFYFGQHDRAWPVVEAVRQLLLQGALIPVEQTGLVCAYVRVLGEAPLADALPRLDELFAKVKRIQDAFTTNSHYSLSRLDLIESAVLALVQEHALTGGVQRRWLDDDEFLVRRRIHEDMRSALEAAEACVLKRGQTP